MPTLLWDASALIKRYAPEPGSDTVDALYTAPQPEFVTTIWGYAETFAALLRKRNSGAISDATLTTATTALPREVLTNRRYKMLTIDDGLILSGLKLVQQHNINTMDAAILTVFLQFAHSQPTGDPICVLIASDKRLLRAAEAEGLKTLNP